MRSEILGPGVPILGGSGNFVTSHSSHISGQLSTMEEFQMVLCYVCLSVDGVNGSEVIMVDNEVEGDKEMI